MELTQVHPAHEKFPKWELLGMLKQEILRGRMPYPMCKKQSKHSRNSVTDKKLQIPTTNEKQTRHVATMMVAT